jgi:DNA-binding PadR family transcriptional regulator
VDSNVYSALSRLERDGLVQTHKPSSGYEATPAGIRHFEQWLFASSSAPPLRDELHMKMALCQPQNLPRMIELVYGQELVCLGRVQELKQSFERMRPPEPHRWSGMVMVMVRDAELAFWESRLGWLQGVRESLEHMGSEFEGASLRHREE